MSIEEPRHDSRVTVFYDDGESVEFVRDDVRAPDMTPCTVGYLGVGAADARWIDQEKIYDGALAWEGLFQVPGFVSMRLPDGTEVSRA
jgi:hypothetical protein